LTAVVTTVDREVLNLLAIPGERLRLACVPRAVRRLHDDRSCIAASCFQVEQMSRTSRFAKPFRVKSGRSFRLRNIDPQETGDIKSKEEAAKWLRRGIARLCDLQEKMYAQDRWALLLIFQAMDAAGKDGTIKHVMSGVNPQGCQVYSFKAPSAEELDHDFLWRTNRCLPERGRIGIFNRSYYEETLVVRVRPDILEKQKLPPVLLSKNIWRERFADINSFERYATRNGIAIRKFFLYVSRGEQKRRLLSRLDRPEKNWKFSVDDAQSRNDWTPYMNAYQEVIRETSTSYAPWYVVPADHKWFTRLVVAAAVIDALEEMALAFPTLSRTQRHQLADARAALDGHAQRKSDRKLAE
jgi:PPK2 family polyphosphate:nucleotide phosphotransferase